MSRPATIGVEEELHLVDPTSRTPAPEADSIIAEVEAPPGAQVEHEIKRSMIETGTPVCTTTAALADELRHLRAVLARAAEQRGLRIASCGVLPTGAWRESELSDAPRYRQLAELHGQIVHEQVVCGLHVHVGVPDRELALAVLDRIGPWLPPLLALSASSPLFEGYDTGFASYRAMVYDRWATASMPGHLPDLAAHDQLVDDLVGTGTILDRGQIYWPARLSRQYPTIEFRIADASPTVEGALLQAVLARAIVALLTADVHAGVGYRLPFNDELGPRMRDELTRAAGWQAARFGLDGDLLDLRGHRRLAAGEALQALLRQLTPALADVGDLDVAHELLADVTRGGGPAARIRAAALAADATAATDLVIAETTRNRPD